MTPDTLLSYLAERDVRLWSDKGKLRCNAPKGVLTPALRKSIAHHKAALLLLLAKKESTNTSLGSFGAKKGALKPIPRDGALPLSFSQERIWALNRVDPESNATGNLPFAFRMTGALDVTALEKSIHELIRRHEVLRTCCQTVDGCPVQSILPAIPFHLPVHDLRTLSLSEKEATVRQMAKQSATAPFNLAEAPILRAKLLHTGCEEYLLLLTTHVYVFDGWSSAILFHEISSLYTDFSAGRASTLPQLLAQYVDFAHWHRNWLTDKVVEQQKNYWKETLAGASLVTDLPLNRPRKANPSQQSAGLSFTVPDFLTRAVRALSQQSGTTLFITLMAAFQTLLQRCTEQENVTIGTIVSNRKVAETEQMIGSFANNILIRADFEAGVTFQELINQVRKKSQAAYSNQDLPLEALLGELDGTLNRSPLFRVMFLFHQHQSTEPQGLHLPGVKVTKFPLEKGISKYELNLVMTDFNGILAGTFEYSTELFDEPTIKKMQENLLIILRKVTVNPARPLSDLPFPPAPEDSFFDKSGTQTKADDTAPSTPTEATIAQIWQKLFGIEKIGIHESFFELGGHSLLAVRILSEIEKSFSAEITIKSLLEFPTIAEFSRLIAALKR